MPLAACIVCGERNRTYYAKTCSVQCRDALKLREYVASVREVPTPPAVSGALWLPLSKGKFALLDEDMFEPAIALGHWYLNNNGAGYAAHRTSRRVFGRRIIYLHRLVMNEPVGFVDHINRDTLDCRRQNLRTADRCGSNANRGKHARANASSSFKGVSRDKSSRNRWRAIITIDYHTIALGSYPSELEAALAYDQAAREHWGEFALTNFPSSVGKATQ